MYVSVRACVRLPACVPAPVRACVSVRVPASLGVRHSTSARACVRLCLPYHPSRGAGALSGDVVAHPSVLAGASLLALLAVLPRRAQVLTAAAQRGPPQGAVWLVSEAPPEL